MRSSITSWLAFNFTQLILCNTDLWYYTKTHVIFAKMPKSFRKLIFTRINEYIFINVGQYMYIFCFLLWFKNKPLWDLCLKRNQVTIFFYFYNSACLSFSESACARTVYICVYVARKHTYKRILNICYIVPINRMKKILLQ